MHTVGEGGVKQDPLGKFLKNLFTKIQKFDKTIKMAREHTTIHTRNFSNIIDSLTKKIKDPSHGFSTRAHKIKSDLSIEILVGSNLLYGDHFQ